MSDKKNMVYSSPHSAVGQKCSECGCTIEEGGHTLIGYDCTIDEEHSHECYDYDYECDDCPYSTESGERIYVCSDCEETRAIFNSNEYGSLWEDVEEAVDACGGDVELQKLDKLPPKAREKVTELIDRYCKE